MRIRDRFVVGVVCWQAGLGCALAQGTKVWTVSRYDEMERGTAERGGDPQRWRLEAGPATSLLYETGGNYVWSVAADAAGNAYVGMGGTAAGGAVVMRVAPDGKATKVFEGKELGVQALRVGGDGQRVCGDVAGWEGLSAGSKSRRMRRWSSTRRRQRRSRSICGM